MPRCRIRAHYEQISEFDRGRIIGLKEAGWTNRRIARHLSRSNATIRRCWQGWVENGRVQRQDDSGWHRATTGCKDRVIVRSVVTAPSSSLSTIRRSNPNTSVHHDHSQTVEREKSKFATTIMPTYNHLPLTLSGACNSLGAWLHQVGILPTGDVQSLVTNSASNCVLTIIEDVFGTHRAEGGSCFHYCTPLRPSTRHYGLMYHFL